MNNYNIMNINSKFKLIVRNFLLEGNIFNNLELFIHNNASEFGVTIDNVFCNKAPDHSLELRVKIVYSPDKFKSLEDMNSTIRLMINKAICDFISTENSIDACILNNSVTYNFTIEETENLCSIFNDRLSLENYIDTLNGNVLDYENYILRI